ncbi:MAG: glycoside hydrolase family 95 protein, partial [Cytophagaceae bacterium]
MPTNVPWSSFHPYFATFSVMSPQILLTCAVLMCTLTSYAQTVQPPKEPLSLWYRQPAQKWEEALPLGNGRLGAMVFGDPQHERLQLNEDTFWSAGPYDPNNPEHLVQLPTIRQLIWDGKSRDAYELAKTMLSNPVGQMSYQPIGDLLLEVPGEGESTNYRRDLNLDNAVATTTYERGGVHFTREVFSSAADGVLVVYL